MQYFTHGKKNILHQTTEIGKGVGRHIDDRTGGERDRDAGTIFYYGEQYILFIEKRIPKSKLTLFQCHEGRLFLKPIPIKTSTSTLREVIEYWLITLKRYLVKKRNKKHSQTRCSSNGNGEGR